MDRETPNVILVNRLIRIGLVLALVAAAIVAIGIVDRKKQEQMLQKKVESERVLPVRIVKPESGNPDEDLVLPGNVMPFYEAPIYARVNGYLKAWYTDYGAHVRKGDLLGVIETPELDEEIQKGEADLATAEVNWELAEVTSKRWQNLLPSNSVSKQEVDEKMGDAKAKAAIVQSVRSNLETLKTRRSFNQLIAPFDGVVTDRRTDIGQLINAGFGTGQELFKVADIKKLRIYVDVPQRFAGEIRKGMTAELS
jgi:RND family efflux transporter MFP subunit